MLIALESDTEVAMILSGDGCTTSTILFWSVHLRLIVIKNEPVKIAATRGSLSNV